MSRSFYVRRDNGFNSRNCPHARTQERMTEVPPAVVPVEGDVEDELSSEGDMPELEAVEGGEEEGGPAGQARGPKQSRGEKKSRRAIQKLGMKPLGDIKRVTIKKSKSVLFVISDPEVYKGQGDVYIIFGEAKIDDMSGTRQQEAAKHMVEEEGEEETPDLAPISIEGAGGEEEVVEEKPGEFPEEDINLVMQQGNVSRGKAIGALRKSGGDVVNSIMELSG